MRFGPTWRVGPSSVRHPPCCHIRLTCFLGMVARPVAIFAYTYWVARPLSPFSRTLGFHVFPRRVSCFPLCMVARPVAIFAYTYWVARPLSPFSRTLGFHVFPRRVSCFPLCDCGKSRLVILAPRRNPVELCARHATSPLVG